MIGSSDTDQASVVFLGRDSFRMQVVGAPAAAANVGAIPNGNWETPTERIFERRRSSRVLRPVPEWGLESTPPPTSTISKSTIVGVGFITFACGVLVATAVDRLRPHTGFPDRILQITAAPAVPPPPPPTNIQAGLTPIVQPLPKAQTEPAPVPLLAAHPLAPAPAREAKTGEAKTGDAKTGDAKTDEAKAATPAQTTKATPAPRVRVAPTTSPTARPRRPGTTAPTVPLKTTELLWEPPASEKPAATPKSPVTPPTPGKWVDPFAE